MGQKKSSVFTFSVLHFVISAKTHPEKIIALTLPSYFNIILSYDSFQFMYAFARCSYPKRPPVQSRYNFLAVFQWESNSRP